MNEEIHFFIHSVSNYKVPNYMLSSVLCFEKTVVSKTQPLPLEILWAYRGLSTSQWGGQNAGGAAAGTSNLVIERQGGFSGGGKFR